MHVAVLLNTLLRLETAPCTFSILAVIDRIVRTARCLSWVYNSSKKFNDVFFCTRSLWDLERDVCSCESSSIFGWRLHALPTWTTNILNTIVEYTIPYGSYIINRYCESNMPAAFGSNNQVIIECMLSTTFLWIIDHRFTHTINQPLNVLPPGDTGNSSYFLSRITMRPVSDFDDHWVSERIPAAMELQLSVCGCLCVILQIAVVTWAFNIAMHFHPEAHGPSIIRCSLVWVPVERIMTGNALALFPMRC